MNNTENNELSKNNYRRLMTEGSLITLGRSFIDASTVASVFIDIFTGNLQLAGIVSSLRGFIAVIMQTFIGPKLLHLKNQPKVIFTGKFFSAIMLFLMPLILLLGVKGNAAAYAFIVIYSLIWIIDGVIIVPWFILNVRTLPYRLRNTVLTNRTFFGGILVFAFGYLIRWFLKHPDMTDPTRFIWIFGIGAVIMTGSSLFYAGMKDVKKPKYPEKKPIRDIFKKMPSMIKNNKLFRDYIIIRILLSFALMSAWFIILFARRVAGVDNAQTAVLIIVQTAGSLVSGLLWSWTNHKLGTKVTIVSMRCIIIVMLSLTIPYFINPGIGLGLIYVICFLNGLTINLFFGDTNYMTDIIGYEKDNSDYMVTNSLISIPFALLNAAAGAVAQQFGFIPIFATSAAASLIVILMGSRLLSMKEIDRLHEQQLKEREQDV